MCWCVPCPVVLERMQHAFQARVVCGCACVDGCVARARVCVCVCVFEQNWHMFTLVGVAGRQRQTTASSPRLGRDASCVERRLLIFCGIDIRVMLLLWFRVAPLGLGFEFVSPRDEETSKQVCGRRQMRLTEVRTSSQLRCAVTDSGAASFGNGGEGGGGGEVLLLPSLFREA